MNNKIIKTPIKGVEVELKEWITGEEGEIINAPMTDVNFKINSQGQGATELNVGEAMKKSTEKAVEVVIVRVGEDKGDFWKVIRQLPNTDYKFILKEVDKIVSGKDFTKPVSTIKDGTV